MAPTIGAWMGGDNEAYCSPFADRRQVLPRTRTPPSPHQGVQFNPSPLSRRRLMHSIVTPALAAFVLTSTTTTITTTCHGGLDPNVCGCCGCCCCCCCCCCCLCPNGVALVVGCCPCCYRRLPLRVVRFAMGLSILIVAGVNSARTPHILPRIFSRVRMGVASSALLCMWSLQRNSPVTSRCGSLLLSLSADVRGTDDVIARPRPPSR